MVRTLAAVLTAYLIGASVPAISAPVGNCSSEPQLAGRDDVLMCEPWESDTWWSDNTYTREGGLPPSNLIEPSQDLEYASITSTGCREGNCLKLHAQQGVTRALSIHWPLSAVGLEPEELYFRYHMRLGPNWNAHQCDSSGNDVWPPAGKFPGLADVRDWNDPVGQCGNGGAKSDGLACWSARGVFAGCGAPPNDGSFSYSNTCEFIPGATTRIGSYLYIPDTDTTHGANGLWDSVAEMATLGDDYTSSCRRSDPDNIDPACYCDSTNNVFCGIGTGGMLKNNQWYAIETYVKMNTPGVADGILRGWIDGVLSYEKRNVVFRKVGHDNLHVRSVWLNVYKGGVNGNCADAYVYLDQMVVALEPIGVLDGSGGLDGDFTAPQPPSSLIVQ